MNTDSPSPPKSGAVPTSRRSALLEMAGIAVVLAIPIWAASVTANPIPNPPHRDTLNIMTPARLEAEEQQRAETKRRRAAAKEALKETADDGSNGADRERRRSRDTEQGASQP